MKVFLVQAPLWGLSPPIGLAQLGAYLQDAGHQVRAFDVNIDLYRRRGEAYRFSWEGGFSSLWTQEAWVAKCLDSHREFLVSEYLRPIASAGEAVVGFSVNACSLTASLEMAKRVKEAAPGTKVVFGGQHFSVRRDDASAAIRSGLVDAVVLGDGEHTFAELLQRWSDGRDLQGCAGLCYPERSDPTFAAARKPVSLDTLPFADYRLFDLTAYENYDSNLILFMASRGCVRSCLFCGYRTPWAGFRAMSGDRIYAEIKHQEKIIPRVRGLYFYDLLINGDMGALDQLCDRIIAGSSVYRHPWEYCNCIIRPEMTREFCDKMKRAGCSHVQIGLESGSQNVLNLMKKEQDVGTMEAVLKNLADAGIAVKGNFMFGFPGETEKDFEDTLAFLRRVHPYLPKVYPSYTFTLMEPASPVAMQREKHGVVGEGAGSDMFWESADGTNTYPARFERYRRFCDEAEAVGLEVEYGYDCPVDAFQSYWLGQYYKFKGDHGRRLEQYEIYLGHDPLNDEIRREKESCLAEIAKSGRERPVRERRDARLRILCLGDAFTAGGGTRSGGAYPAHLKRLIYERYGTGARLVQVINAAEPHASSSTILRDLEGRLAEHRPDLVLLMTGHNNNVNFESSAYPIFMAPSLSSKVMLLLGAFSCAVGDGTAKERRPAEPREWISQVLRRISQLNGEKRFKESIEFLKEAITRDSKDFRLHHGLGYLYLSFMNKPALALPHLEKACALDPTNLEATAHLFTAYHRLSDARRAIRTAWRLHRLDPENAVYRQFVECGVPAYYDYALYRRVFTHDADRIAALCRKQGAQLRLQTYPGSHWLNEAVVSAAVGAGVSLIDHRRIFGDDSGLYYENLLPNSRGARRLAENVFSALEPDLLAVAKAKQVPFSSVKVPA